MNTHFSSFLKLAKKTLWVLPFTCFLFGYYAMSIIMPTSYVSVPSVVEKNLYEALKLTSENNLTLKIIETREDTTIQEPKVTQQTPTAGTHVKPQHAVHLIISIPPHAKNTPNFTGLTIESWKNLMQNLKNTVLPIPSNAILNTGTCIAQLPEAGTPLEKQTTLYVNTPEDLFLVPSLIDHSLFEVEDLLKKVGIPYQIHEQGRRPFHTLLETAQVIEQQPCAGTFLSLKNPPMLHLNVQY